MAENSEIVIKVVENIKIDDQKNIKNGDVHVTETPQLENGDVKKTPEEVESASTAEECTAKSSDVAGNRETATPEDDTAKQGESQVIDKIIEEEPETKEVVTDDDRDSKIIEELEEGNSEITRSFEVIQISENVAESKGSNTDEIITLQEVTILPHKEVENQSTNVPQKRTQLVSWDIKKTIFFYFFLLAFIAWIIAYYAFDTGLIPNDKK